MSKIIDSSYLKVIIDDDGTVWGIDGDKLPKILFKSPNEFYLTINSTTKYKCIRMLATPENYHIIDALYHLKVDNKIDSLQLASPSMMQKDRPESSLIRMRLCTLPASLGGWHEITDDEAVIYKIACFLKSLFDERNKFKKDGSIRQSFINNQNSISLTISQLVLKHPLFKRLSFIDDLDPVSLAKIVGSICDPRWFVDNERPERLSKLYSWMGISGPVDSPIKALRRQESFLCWAGDPEEGFMSYRHDAEKLKFKLKEPGCFIIRHAYEKYGNKVETWPFEKITKYFLKFLKMSWLDSIYSYPNPWMEPVFDYSQFFKNKDDLKAFTDFIKK